MRINDKCRIREIANEFVIIFQGEHGSDATKVIALNITALYLFETFSKENDFTKDDVVEALLSKYGISQELATKDAEQWIEELSSHNVIIA